MNLMRGIDLKKIAGKMNGSSGAELKVCFCLIYFFVSDERHFSSNEQVVVWAVLSTWSSFLVIFLLKLIHLYDPLP